MKILIALSENRIKVRKMGIYRFLISFPVTEKLRFLRFEKGLKKWYKGLSKINQN